MTILLMMYALLSLVAGLFLWALCRASAVERDLQPGVLPALVGVVPQART